MANKDNFKPVTGERDDYTKPKDTGMGRPEDQSRDRGTEVRDRGTEDRDLDEDIRPKDKGR